MASASMTWSPIAFVFFCVIDRRRRRPAPGNREDRFAVKKKRKGRDGTIRAGRRRGMDRNGRDATGIGGDNKRAVRQCRYPET